VGVTDGVGDTDGVGVTEGVGVGDVDGNTEDWHEPVVLSVGEAEFPD